MSDSDPPSLSFDDVPNTGVWKATVERKLAAWTGALGVIKWMLGLALGTGVLAAATFATLVIRLDERQHAADERLARVAGLVDDGFETARATATDLKTFKAAVDVERVADDRDRDQVRARLERLEQRRQR